MGYSLVFKIDHVDHNNQVMLTRYETAELEDVAFTGEHISGWHRQIETNYSTPTHKEDFKKLTGKEFHRLDIQLVSHCQKVR